MPSLDMPLEELKTYRGAIPAPANFDKYWDLALKELDAIGVKYVFEDAPFSAPGVTCKYLYFDGVSGARICCKFLCPDKTWQAYQEKASFSKDTQLPAIAMFHGYFMDSGGWFEKLPYAYAGFTVLAMDVRGQMGNSIDTKQVEGNTLKGHIIRGLRGYDPENLFFRNVYLDAAQTVRVLMSLDFVDENRVGATGPSQGGALTIACAALEPKVKLLAPIFPFLSDFKRTWEMDLFKQAYEELSYFIRYQEPRQKNLDKMFETLSYIDVSNLAPRVKGETYMFITLLDDICPPSTQFAAYNKITTKKSCEIYPNHAHEKLPESDELIFECFKGL